jgi:ATP-dependent DNA helicase
MAETNPALRKALATLDFPDFVLETWESDGITSLLPLQARALANPELFRKSSLIIGPTSSGKTFVGEIVCLWQALQSRRSLYLVPFKAIAEEKYQDFRRKYGGDALGARVVLSTGDRREQDRAIIDSDYQIAILTYEKLSSLIITAPGILANVGALVVDEVQMLSDPARGGELELLLTRARQIAPALQVVGLSAVVSDLRGFDKWLDAVVIRDEHRPVALREGVLAPNGSFKYVEWNGPHRKPGAENLPALTGTDEEELAVALVAHLLKVPGEQVVVFAPTVAKTRTLARQIAQQVAALLPAKQPLERLAGLERTESVSALTETLTHAIAFHNGDLTLEERLTVEEGFRKRQVRCIVATSTLAMGVNLPASSSVIVKSFRNVREKGIWQEVPIAVAEYRNMSGRAGRFGLTTDPFGRSFLICRSPLQQAALTRTFVQADSKPLESVLPKTPIPDMVLKTMASRLCETADGFFRFLLRTYAGQTHFSDAQLQADAKVQVDEAIAILIDGGLLARQDRGRLIVTAIGRICAASGLRVESFLPLVNLVDGGRPSATDVAQLASTLEDAGPKAAGVWVTDEESATRGALYLDLVRQAESVTPGSRTSAMLAEYNGVSFLGSTVATAMKYQATAMAFITGIASQSIEENLSVSAGKARAVGSLCSWLCDTASKIAWVQQRPDDARAYEILSDRFLHGCSEDALLLSSVPHGLHRAEREALVGAGFKSFQSILDATPIEIARTAKVNRARVEDLQRSIISVLGESLALERMQLARLRTLGVDTAPIEGLFVLKGAALEQAIEDLLVQPFCPLKVTRITAQREGEADLRIILGTGHTGIAQVTAKDSPRDKVGIAKATSVLGQSPELSPRVFICIGRPDFLDDAIKKAHDHATNGQNFKLIPIRTLAEMYVRFREGALPSARVQSILETDTGYIDVARI